MLFLRCCPCYGDIGDIDIGGFIEEEEWFQTVSNNHLIPIFFQF